MTKQEIGEILSAYKEQMIIQKEQITLLKEQLAEAKTRENKLTAQVDRLQDGLMAIRSPEAYKDMRADQGEYTISAEQADFQKKEMHIRKIRESYLRAMEGNALKTGEDLDALMESVITRGHVAQSKSLHGNAES